MNDRAYWIEKLNGQRTIETRLFEKTALGELAPCTHVIFRMVKRIRKTSMKDHVMAKPSPSFAGDPALVKIGEVIRRTRKEQGLSQELLAVDAGVDRSYMGGIERGEHNLTVMSLVRIASALNCKAATLLEKAEV